MSGVRAHIASRLGGNSSLNAVPPPPTSADYSIEHARTAARVLYPSPLPSKENRPVYILNAAALPDAKEADFDSLLPYVLARLPEEDELLSGSEYEVIFFAGDSDGSASTKKNRPGLGWFIQAYHVLSRAMRKRLQRLYIVHERAWVRILTEIFATIVSSKFRRKITHASSMSNLALHYPIEDLLIPPSAYLHDRRVSDDIFAPYASGRRAFGVRRPFPTSTTGKTRFPRVLRETTNFVLLEENIITEGIFRIPGHAKLKEVLKEAYDRGQKFIIWKENGTILPVPKYPHAENIDEIIEELDQRDAYGVAMASGLIKAWYADLYQPIFPESTYPELKRLFGDPDDLPTLESLKDLISPSSEWSFLPPLSREIMTRHLLPMLSAIAARQDQNKMTPENLAVCFAPALLHGPDQLADAKMSSVIRRVFTVAIELWSDGLREACGISQNQFEHDLRFPEDQADWEDPLEGGAHAAVTDEKHETQVTGVILQDNNSRDNELPSRPPPLPPRSMHSPPLPPRSSNSLDQSASGKSSNDTATRRKPAPPLLVPPRYSTIVADSPLDVSESPINYAAVVDGFPPPQSSQAGFPDEKKSGTKTSGDSHPPQIVLPKRKALTAEQINNAESAVAQVQARKQSDSRVGLPGLTGGTVQDFLRRKSLPFTEDPMRNLNGSKTSLGSQPEDTTSFNRSVSSMEEPQNPAFEFRRPSLPASANRTPNITSLARPVYPSPHATPNRPPSKSTSLPVPTPKPRALSPGLLQRMPSFEPSKSPSLRPERATPHRLNMKKASVDDLRRLYEERAGTAKSLVQAAKEKK